MKYTTLAVLFVLAALTSCIDDDLDSCIDIDDLEIPKGITDGYSLNLTVTLDKMGGGTTTRSLMTKDEYGKNPMEEIENYINPEKFRVLFFNNKEEFLFESKSRWVRKLDSDPDHSEWFVSVPVFSYGNDEGERWDWEAIRDALTGANGEQTFKIAIMANRPEWECFPDLDSNNSGKSKKFDNSGPHWGADDTSWGAAKKGLKAKKIFDLHHCQPDPIYESKSKPKKSNSDKPDYVGEYFYEFVMGKENVANEERLTMSATSCWVDHGDNLEDDGEKDQKKRRYWRKPSQSYPIPLYGVQEFDIIKHWMKGTPFNLSKLSTKGKDDEGDGFYNFKSISLLRSVVKLELRIPKNMVSTPPRYVAIFYTNVYARCEPMDVWTPTNIIWEGQDKNHDNHCEIDMIKQYGQIVKNGDQCQQGKTQPADNKAAGWNDYWTGYYKESFDKFRQRISWFYGAWKERGWTFGTFGAANVGVDNTENLPFPRVFNPCTQRNQVVRCEKVDYTADFDDGYYHWVVYTGERNINDPSYLQEMGQTIGFAATVAFWVIEIDGQVYRIPITDYKDYGKKEGNNYLNPVSKISFESYKSNENSGEPDNGGMQQYSVDIFNDESSDYLPWPLVRNHVYRITLTGNGPEPGGAYDWDFTTVSDETINNMTVDTNWHGPRHRDKDTEKDSDNDYYDHWYNLSWPSNYNNNPLSANNQVIKELEYLTFSYGVTNGETINFERVYGTKSNKIWSNWYLRLNKDFTITFPKVKKGQRIIIKGLMPVTAGYKAGGITDRYIKPVASESYKLKFISGPNADGNIIGQGKGGTNALHTFIWEVESTSSQFSNVQFKVTGGGLAFTEFHIEKGDDAAPQNARATRAAGKEKGFKVKMEDLYSKSIKFK